MKPRPRWAFLRPWQTNALLLLLGIGLMGFTYQLTKEFTHFEIGFSLTAGWSIAIYLCAVILVLTQRTDRFTLPLILLIALACRAFVLFPYPHMSSDIYRYVWDGIVQHAHISPYRYVPGDPVLTHLRAPNQWVFDHINRRDYAHTIYPPAAQFIFYLVTFFSATVTAMKIAMLLFECVTVYALIQLLKDLGFAKERCVLYAWCPLLAWEIGSSGHVDAIAIAFIALALLSRYRKQPVLTGLFLGLAIITKLYPVIFLPALFRRGEYKMPATAAAVIAFGYACYASVGLRVFGFLGGYVKEEGIETGSRYFLLELAQHLPGLHELSTTAYMLFAAAVFAALLLWCWKICYTNHTGAITNALFHSFNLPRDAQFLLPAFALALALMLLFSPHYPWYLAWLIPFLTLVPNLTVMVYVCGFFYMCTTSLAVGTGPSQFILNEIVYAQLSMALLLETAIRVLRRRVAVRGPGPSPSDDVW
jgi:alpha-1,6-mannosyltransferase